MSTKKLIPKHLFSNKHFLINDIGIGSNRIIITNCYLNNYNYYNKSSIKLSEIRKQKYLERKLQLEEFKKEKAIPGQLYSIPYYNYNNKNNISSNNNYKTINYESNKNIKIAEINYLDKINHNKSNENHKVNLNKIKLKRNYKLFDDLISNLNKRRINYKRYKIKTDINNKSFIDKICNSNNSNAHDNNKSNIKEENYKLSEGNINSNTIKQNEENSKYKQFFRKSTSDTKYKINSYYDRKDRDKDKNKNKNKNKTINKEIHINKTNDNFNVSNITNLKNRVNFSFTNNIFTNINFFSHKNFRDLKINAEKLNSDLINISPYYKRIKHEEVKEKNINETESKNSLFPLIK